MSTAATEIRNGARARAGYYLADGSRVPSVTTILGVINKPALVRWANKLGLQGIDSTKYVDALADIGTLAHAFATADLRGAKPDFESEGYDKATVDVAENCYLSFLSWCKGKVIEPVLMEEPLVSELYRFGGKFDFYGRIDGTLVLLDLKTGKGIWPEHFYQLSAYRQLLIENKYAPPEAYTILNIPRAETESFDAKTRTGDMAREFQTFMAALTIYRNQQKD